MLVKLYRNFIPEILRTKIYNLFLKQVLSFCRAPLFSLQKIFLKTLINSYYKRHNQYLGDEYAQAVKFINDNGLQTFLSNFIFKYKKIDVNVFFSEERKMNYVIHEGKKLFFPISFTKSQIRGYYVSLLLEQDEKSPHCYTHGSHHLYEGDVLFDIGTAEGIFTLSHIDRISHAYLFEYDSEWIGALEATFEPWKDKVTIVKALVSDKIAESSITLDSFIQENSITKVDFIKMDIEGWEIPTLSASVFFLGSLANIRLSICCYHRMSDEISIKNILTSLGFVCQTSEGYMLVRDIDKQILHAPYLKRGLIYAYKDSL